MIAEKKLSMSDHFPYQTRSLPTQTNACWTLPFLLSEVASRTKCYTSSFTMQQYIGWVMRPNGSFKYTIISLLAKTKICQIFLIFHAKIDAIKVWRTKKKRKVSCADARPVLGIRRLYIWDEDTERGVHKFFFACMTWKGQWNGYILILFYLFLWGMN